MLVACNSNPPNFGCDKYMELTLAQTKSQPLSDARVILSPKSISHVREGLLESKRVIRVTLKSKAGQYSNIFINPKEYDYIVKQIRCNNQ